MLGRETLTPGVIPPFEADTVTEFDEGDAGDSNRGALNLFAEALSKLVPEEGKVVVLVMDSGWANPSHIPRPGS
tara:strand:+ start:333 stop:554 length:222 start_codon:yes stop_codon:yes gene_type:complete